MSFDAGQSPFYTSYYGGMQLKTSQLWSYRNYGLDIEGQPWYQPCLQLATNEPPEVKKYWGGLLGIHNQLKTGQFFSLNA